MPFVTPYVTTTKADNIKLHVYHELTVGLKQGTVINNHLNFSALFLHKHLSTKSLPTDAVAYSLPP